MRGEAFYKCMAGTAVLMLLGAGCKSKGTTELVQIPGINKVATNPTNPTNPNDPFRPGNPYDPNNPPTGTDNRIPTTWPVDPTQGFTIPYDFKRDVFQRVHFDYDSSELRASDSQLVETVAAYLLQNPTHLLLVEGHCDERGTEEYNLSLGERRALAVFDELIRSGISSARMRTQSYGEKVPLDASDKAEARSKNRRGEFVLVVPVPNRQPAPSRRINLGSGQ